VVSRDGALSHVAVRVAEGICDLGGPLFPDFAIGAAALLGASN
jgi:hypothetical protein